MSDSSFIPERQLVFSPGLAQAIGLEEAVLLQHLGELYRHRSATALGGQQWITVEWDWLLDTLPFWSIEQLQGVCQSLCDKGVILLQPETDGDAQHLVFALNESRRQPRQKQPSERRVQVPSRRRDGEESSHEKPAGDAEMAAKAQRAGRDGPADSRVAPASGWEQATRQRAYQLRQDWHPSEDMLQLLGLNHGIPRQFALQQLEDFVCYWTERGEASHAWENKFRQHVLSRWRQSEQSRAELFSTPPETLSDNWQPSADALEILDRAGINRAFIDDAVPEFVLYWSERNPREKALNSKFIQHIKRQWARYTSALSHDTEPQRIPTNWQPTEDVFDILNMSHIDASFARKLIPEFIMYWKDSNQMHSSWNTKFLQHVKYHWAKQSKLADGTASSRTRDRSLAEDLNDRSWAH